MKDMKPIDRLRSQLERWWHARYARERWLLGAAGALVVVVLPYVAVWEPMAERTAALKQQVAEQREELAWMRSAAEAIRQVAWLDGLQGGSGVRVEAMTVKRSETPGLVSAQLTLEVGP